MEGCREGSREGSREGWEQYASMRSKAVVTAWRAWRTVVAQRRGWEGSEGQVGGVEGGV